MMLPEYERDKNYCLRCGIERNYPGVTFDGEGVCSICRPTEEAIRQFRLAGAEIENRWKRFVESSETGLYDCMVMLSGGKDSTFVLLKILDATKRPLGWTFDNPMEHPLSREILHKDILRKLPIEHLSHTANTQYFQIMKKTIEEAFSDSEPKEMAICEGCGEFCCSLALGDAQRMNIPFVILGFDPFQARRALMRPGIYRHPRFVYYPFDPQTYLNEISGIRSFCAERVGCDFPGESLHCQWWPVVLSYGFKKLNTYYHARKLAADVRSGRIDRETAILKVEEWRRMALDPGVLTSARDLLRTIGVDPDTIFS